MSFSTTVDFGTIRTNIVNGFLYNWFVISDVRNISIAGWHVPSYSEFVTLSTYLGGNSVSGGKLKEVGTTYWNTPNTGATNESLFNLRGSGYLDSTFGFRYILETIQLWTTTSSLGDPARYCCLIANYNSGSIILNNIAGYLTRNGYSIRLIKDSTTLSNGQEGIYIGNDGKTYRTICIGTQEWLADNLCETKYRNGDNIVEEKDYTKWPPLTSGVYCYYNNDLNNAYF